MEKTITVYPVMDTYIDSSLPKSNFSDKNFYFLGYFKLSTRYRVLMKFDTSSIPKGAKIKKAVLKLYCTRNDFMEQENKFEIHPILSPWQSLTVNYENQPRFDIDNYVQMKVDFSLYENINVDITKLVQSWHEKPNSNFGFLIKAKNESNEESLLAILSDRQGYRQWKPCLELSLNIQEPEINLNEEKKVAIVTPQFLEWNGERCIFGGGERYLAELAKLIISMGYQVDVFQPSNGLPWKKIYNGINIYGIGDNGFDEDFFISLNKKFFSISEDYNLHIYLSMDLTYPNVFPNSICVSHGVWWDSSERPWWRSKKWYSRLFNGLNLIETLVSVDTNTINWINAVNPEIKCNKVFVPNYVDLDIFKPDDFSVNEDKNTVNILYPRRLVSGRGWCVTKEIAKELVTERDDISFSFVGRGTKESEKHMEILTSKYPRIDYKWYEFENMYLAYKNIDIVLIPSYYTEGTSFSLIEAMACGKPIISGLVGGLTDLVIDGFNGYLIQVSKNSLKDAILKLVDDKKLREEMGKNALQVAQCFSKRLWEERWKTIIKNHMQ